MVRARTLSQRVTEGMINIYYGRRILDTVHLVLISHAVYTYTVTDFGDFAAVSTPVWSVPPPFAARF